MLQYGSELATLSGKYAIVAARLPAGSSVIDVGCYTGGLARELIARGYAVLGIEKDPEAVRIAQAHGVPVLCGDIEDPAWLAGLDRTSDTILLLDVLEHLRDPDTVLRHLRRLLRPGGRLLVTGPNVAYWALRKMLLFGRWEYGDAGLMDRTHLRFYTKTTWVGLLQRAGYRVVALDAVEAILPLQTRCQRSAVGRAVFRVLLRYALKRWPGLFTMIFLLEAVAADT